MQPQMKIVTANLGRTAYVSEESATSNIFKPLESEIIPNDSSISKPSIIPTFTSEIIDEMNTKTISLFSDSDFRNLISIYLRKPELFSVLAQYVQHGNIIEETFSLSFKSLYLSEFVKFKV